MIFLSDTETSQGSVSWHEWRRQGIGSSDVSAIMGVSPWSTPYQLWLEKTGRKKPFDGNYATARGQELEPLARAAYELQAGYDFEPVLLTHHEAKYMRVSLDGYNAEIERILEIKCPGEADHKIAQNGKVPEKYMPQLQYQLYVAGAKDAHYFSFDGSSGVVVPVYPDIAMQMQIVTQVKEFWENHVLSDTPPALTEKDSLEVSDEHGLFALYSHLERQVKALEERLDKAKSDIIERYGSLHSRVSCGPVTLLKVERKGSVDYGKVPSLKEVDLEQYRKPPSVYFQMKVSE